MKVGIITYHHCENYGALLQGWALRNAVKKLGAAASIVNYVPAHATVGMAFYQGWGLRTGSPVQALKTRWIRFRHFAKIKGKFAEFRRDQLGITTGEIDRARLDDELACYDALIVGSDQVWNPKICDDSIYFLGNLRFPGRRISYAASCGHPEATQALSREAGSWLRRFDVLSVRDGHTADYVEFSGLARPTLVVDPTLLSSDEPGPTVPRRAGNYIATYCLGREVLKANAEFVRQVQLTLGGLPVVSIVSSAESPIPAPYANEAMFDASPMDWLALLSGASFVITDSYHGVLFSIKYRRQFLVIVADLTKGHRIRDVLARYGLESRIVRPAREFAVLARETIDYSRSEPLLARDIAGSNAFLKRALGLA